MQSRLSTTAPHPAHIIKRQLPGRHLILVWSLSGHEECPASPSHLFHFLSFNLIASQFWWPPASQEDCAGASRGAEADLGAGAGTVGRGASAFSSCSAVVATLLTIWAGWFWGKAGMFAWVTVAEKQGKGTWSYSFDAKLWTVVRCNSGSLASQRSLLAVPVPRAAYCFSPSPSAVFLAIVRLCVE